MVICCFFQRHEKIHDIKQPLLCDADGCDYTTGRRDKLKDHIMLHHPLMAINLGYGKAIHCEVKGCERLFVMQSQLKDHLKKTHPETAFQLGYIKEYKLKSLQAKTPTAPVQVPKVQLRFSSGVPASLGKASTSGGMSLAIAGPHLDKGDKPLSAVAMIKLLTSLAKSQKAEKEAAASSQTPSSVSSVKLIYHPSPSKATHPPGNTSNLASPSNTTPILRRLYKTVTKPTGEVVVQNVTPTIPETTTTQQSGNTFVLNIAPNSQY